jgi:hypothetical protein
MDRACCRALADLFLRANAVRHLVGIPVGIRSDWRLKLSQIQLVILLGGCRPGAPSFAAARLRLAQPTSALLYAVAKLVRRSLLARPDDVATISYSIVKEPRGYACAFPRQDLPEPCWMGPSKDRGRRESRVPVAPAASRAKVTKHTSIVTTGSPETSGLPCAMVLTAYFALSPVTGLFCHRRLRNTFRELDASVGASGPHDFAVRVGVARQRHLRVHRIPLPTFVTIAKRPSW